MALIAVDVNAVREYSLKADVGDDKTVFQIGLLDAPLRAHIEDKGLSYSVNATSPRDSPADVKMNLNQRALEVVRFGLRGWKNFKDSQGRDVQFDRVSQAVPGLGNRYVVSDVSLRALEMDWIKELAGEISGDNAIDEAEKKKSE
jgi:hypothetical protein